MREDIRSDMVDAICTKCPYYGECHRTTDCAAFTIIGELIEKLSSNNSDE